MKTQKKLNLKKGYEELDILAALDFQVQQFSAFHFRINNRLDVWPSSQTAYDRISNRKEHYTDLVRFAQSHFKRLQEVIRT